jgi:DNA polymerase III subunit delta
MAEHPARVIILCGEDEFAVQKLIHEQLAALGDPALADINTIRLDGRSNSLEDLVNAVNTLPFLAANRLVIFFHPLSRLNTPAQQHRLREILERVPACNRLILVEYRLLTDERDRKRKVPHWLEKWALEHTSLVQMRSFPMPVGVALARWIQERAQTHGGQFTIQAANLLSDLVGPEAGALDQEIQKILAYVNFNRPVEGDDVQHLTSRTARVADFALVNALRNKNSRQALEILHRELEETDSILLFFKIVNQFRQLLQVREILENKGQEGDVVRTLKLHPYAARLGIEHARRFSLVDLDAIYQRLLQFDVAMKTGVMEGELALDLLVTELTQ